MQQESIGYVKHRNVEELNSEFLELKKENEFEMVSDIEIKEEEIKEEIEESEKVSEKDSSEKKRKDKLTVELKKEIIEKYEKGMRVVELERLYNRPSSTICTILKKKDMIKALTTAKGVTRLSKQRPPVIDEVEKLLLIWINEKELKGDDVNEEIICEKARMIYSDLIQEQPRTSDEEPPVKSFKASRGWFDNFKRRIGLQYIGKHGEAAISDTRAAEAYVREFHNIVATEGYISQQIFNCDETGLFWKRLPRRTYITTEEKKLPGHKPMKDRMTLLLCANASGDCKIKPLLVYHAENPRAFKKHKVQKNMLQVMWRAHSKAWVVRQFFTEWMNECFGPGVKKYLVENNLPLKCLLVLDNTPGHPPSIEDDLLNEYKFIKVKFLPPLTTPLLQPMDQQVIVSFKKLYTKHLFRRCFEVTEDTKLTLREFWKNHFNIVGCLKIIDKAWQEVTRQVLNTAWRKLWPESVAERDLEGFDPNDPDAVEEVVSLGKTMGLEIDHNDVNELVAEHSEELTTKELLELHKEAHKKVLEEIASSGEEDEVEERVSSTEIKRVLEMWQEVSSFVEKHHPDKLSSGRAGNLFNDNGLGHFRDILIRRKKQVYIERFLVKRSSDASNVSTSSPPSKRRRFSESEASIEVADILMEGDSSKN